MKFILPTFLLTSLFMFGQQNNPKKAFLEKWDNSLNYLLQVVEAMPETYFTFRPTERQMSFEEQLMHIKQNIDWLRSTYFYGMETNASDDNRTHQSKKSLKDDLESSFKNLANSVTKMPEEEFSETQEFFAGPKSRWQILNLLQDHVTHHRGQLIVYLSLKSITPPKYVGW